MDWDIVSKSDMIGLYCFDMSWLYYQKNHEIHNQACTRVRRVCAAGHTALTRVTECSGWGSRTRRTRRTRACRGAAAQYCSFVLECVCVCACMSVCVCACVAAPNRSNIGAMRVCVRARRYLKLSVAVLGPGDKIKVHDEEAEAAAQVRM